MVRNQKRESSPELRVQIQMRDFSSKTHRKKAWRSKSESSKLLWLRFPLRGGAIGSTPDFGSGYPGSSPGPGASLSLNVTNRAGNATCGVVAPSRKKQAPSPGASG